MSLNREVANGSPNMYYAEDEHNPNLNNILLGAGTHSLL